MEASVKSPLRLKLEELFGIDLRSLALFRIGLGLLIVADLISRSADLKAFYTDAGVLPRAALLENPTFFWPISLHMLSGSLWFQVALFLLTGLSALALALGYRTRLATFACWVLVTSLHARNPFINQAGDTLLHLYLFWGLFLPLGARCSVDRGYKPKESESPTRILSGGSIALLLQICLVYWFAAINKTGSLWRDGTALYFVFNLDAMVKAPGTFLLGFPRVIKFLTRYTIWLESWGPFLAFIPVATDLFRTLTVFLFLGFHLGLILCMKLGSFPYFCMLGWLAFLPGGFWEYLRRLSSRWRLPERFQAGPWPRRLARLPRRPVPLRSQPATQVLALITLAYIILINLAFTSIREFRPVFIQKYRWVGKLLSIDQSWAMFAPDPLLENWWYVIPGKLRDGSEVDLYGGGVPLRWEKPDQVPAGISNVKWRKYFNWLPKKRYSAFLPYYARYLCREWNARASGGKKLESLRIYYRHATVLPNFQSSEPQQELLWAESCAGTPESKPSR